MSPLVWVYSINHHNTLWFAPQEVNRIQDTPESLADKSSHNMVWTYPYAGPQHMKVIKTLYMLDIDV
jgi:hypothetical protein